VTRSAGHAAVILGAMNQARAKIVENIERLPEYTCVQTVHRSRFEAMPAVRVSGCGYLQDPEFEPRPMLFWTDRFKLDVTVSEFSEGGEIFPGWARGASNPTMWITSLAEE
jgi:hypothetical protein